MPKRRDPTRTKPPSGADGVPRPEQAAVERALERVVDRLKPKPPAPRPPRRGGG